MQPRLSDLTATIRAQPSGHEFCKFTWLLARHAAVDLASCEKEASRFAWTAPNVEPVVKAAIAAGTTTDATWASELSAYRGLTREWIEDIARQTLFGKLPYVRVPFLTSTIVESGLFSAGWVQAGQPIPVSRATFAASAMLGVKTVGTLVPFTEESFRAWTPAVEANFINAIRNAAIYASDHSALDPDIGATAARPASLTNGILQGQSTGATAAQAIADIKALLQKLVDGGSDLSRVVIAMSPSSALHLSQLLTTGGSFAFPQLTATGGFIWGVPVFITTAAQQVGSPATRLIVAIDGSKILVADDGLVLAEASTAASLQFNNAPTGGPQSMVSLFQTSTRVVRIIRYMNFERARDTAVAWFAVGY